MITVHRNVAVFVLTSILTVILIYSSVTEFHVIAKPKHIDMLCRDATPTAPGGSKQRYVVKLSTVVSQFVLNVNMILTVMMLVVVSIFILNDKCQEVAQLFHQHLPEALSLQVTTQVV